MKQKKIKILFICTAHDNENKTRLTVRKTFRTLVAFLDHKVTTRKEVSRVLLYYTHADCRHSILTTASLRRYAAICAKYRRYIYTQRRETQYTCVMDTIVHGAAFISVQSEHIIRGIIV